MVSGIYRDVGGFSVPASADLTPNLVAVRAAITDPTKSVAADWVGVAPLAGMNPHGVNWLPQTLAWVAGNFGVAPRQFVQGTPFAADTKTEALASGQGAHGMRILQLFTSVPYMVQLGRLAAYDVFVGNGDRVLAGNLGNWFTNLPTTSVSDLIDNADQHARTSWMQGQNNPPQIGGNIIADLGCLSANRIAATARQVAHNLADGVRIAGGFASHQAKTTWLNTVNQALGGVSNWDFMADALETGMDTGRQEIRRTLVNQKRGPTGRAVKGRSAGVTTAAGTDWWDMIKARARQL